LKRLEYVKETAIPKKIQHQWTLGHALIFVGGLLIIAGVIVGGLLLWHGPSDPYANFTPEGMQNLAKNLTPIGSLQLWKRLERSGLEHHKRWDEIDFEDKQAGHQFLWWVWALIPITGIALVAAGIIVLNLKKKKPVMAARA